MTIAAPTFAADGRNIHCTAEEIRAAMFASNRDPENFDTTAGVAERDEQIAAATPVVRVTVHTSDSYGGVYAPVQSGIVLASGAFWPSIIGCPIVHFRKRDGRLTPAESGRRLLRHRFAGVEVPIEWVDGR